MDLDQLHTFLEIVRLKSFSKAAQTCYRTQPAISAQIRQLEQELNASLFERLGTRIQLTPAGRVFAEYAEKILDLRRQAQDAINELERVPRGELVIAANEATCIYVLPGVFSTFKKRFPNVQLLVDRSYGRHVVESVVDNLADFGFTQLPVQEKRLQVVHVYTDEIKLLVPAGHPLAGRQSVTARDVVPYPLLLPKGGATRTRLNQWLEPVEDEASDLDGAGLHGDDQAVRAGRHGHLVHGGFAFPRGRRGGPVRRRQPGAGAADAAAWARLPQGQGAVEGRARIH